MVLEGPLEVSKQGFVLAVLPFGKIQTRLLYYHLERSKQGFVLADLPFKTIWGINTVHSYCISPFKTTTANHGFKWYINLYEKGTKSRRVKEYL